MKRIALLAIVAAAALAIAGAGRSASGLCVGGPHCYPTIQAAVDAAQDGDTIRIGPGTFAGGVMIAKSVSLQGVASAATRITGGGPVVTIGSPTVAPTVTISGVTISGGLTTTNPQSPKCGPDVPTCGPGYADATALGGGIEAFPGTTVTLVGSVVTGNRAVPAHVTQSVKAVCPGPAQCPASFGDAAGIDNGGTMTLIGTTVSDNHASAVQSNGGGIVNEAHATLALLNSRVTGNSASAAPPFGRFASGGGIFLDGSSSLTVENSTIDGNTASLANSIPHPYPMQDGGTDQANAIGGGLWLSDGATVTIRNSSVSGNAVAVDSAGGEPFGADAAFCACGDVPLLLENSRVTGNTLTVNVLSSADTGPSGPGAIEIDGDATIRNTQIVRNATTITTPKGDAGALGAVGFFFGGTTTPTIGNSTIADNSTTANAPNGAATIQGAGITNNGPLLLQNDRVSGNRGSALGASGFVQGGAIWNGVLFGGPVSPLTLQNTTVSGNVLTASAGLTIQGAGIFSPGFPLELQSSVVAHNAPDDCFGC
jgi:hypothetical protein